MRSPRIYTDTPLLARSRLRLDGQTGHYLDRVLRRNCGDLIRLFNGAGGEFAARIISVKRGVVELEVLDYSAVASESPLHCHLGLAVSKGERMDWAVQKCTELGVGAITPLLTARCELKLSADRSLKKVEHWRQIARSACEQSGRDRIPTIGAVSPLANWLENGLERCDAELAIVCSPEGEPLGRHGAPAPRSLRLLVGPEGGLFGMEMAQAQRAGFIAASFGPRVLRTETAPIAVLSVVQFLWGDLGTGPG